MINKKWIDQKTKNKQKMKMENLKKYKNGKPKTIKSYYVICKTKLSACNLNTHN